MHHVSAAIDIDRYLSGDFSVIGATVLAGPSAQLGAPADFVAQFDPGQACTPTDVELDVPTDVGARLGDQLRALR